MKRISYGFIYLLIFCVPLTGYAAFKPVDLNPRIKSGQLVQITNNFVVLFDKSASMGELHGKPMVNEATRLMHGKDAVKNMIATIPEIKLNAGLRTFWDEKTPLARDRLYTIAYGETNPTMYEAAPKEIYLKAAKTNARVLFELILQ